MAWKEICTEPNVVKAINNRIERNTTDEPPGEEIVDIGTTLYDASVTIRYKHGRIGRSRLIPDHVFSSVLACEFYELIIESCCV